MILWNSFWLFNEDKGFGPLWCYRSHPFIFEVEFNSKTKASVKDGLYDDEA